MKKQITTILIIVFTILNIKGQNEPLPEFIPPSPDVFSLAKYVDIPVSYYSGTPAINIPIWTVTDGDISVPISLSYHAGGIKVDEIASWVGLGWSLNAGGVITRVIRDDPDSPDLTGTSLYCARMDETFQWFDDYVQIEGDSPEALNFYYGTIADFAEASNIDNEPDVFYYNFNGKSGKFIFDNDGIARLYKHDNIKITWIRESTNPDSPIQFIIRDELGNSYEFNDLELNYYGGHSPISAWYLSKITSPKGNSITFSYKEHYEWNQYRKPCDEFIPITTGVTPHSPPRNFFDPDLQRVLKLTQISTSRGDTVYFTPGDSPRQDYLTDSLTYPLKEIEIRSANHIERIFALNTSYFVADDSTDVSSNLNLNRRLKLDGVTEYSGDRTDSITVCSFDYFGDDVSESALRLPYRLSPSQDHWGYFNGADNDGILPGKPSGMPIDINNGYQLICENYDRYVSGGYSGEITGADREPDGSRKKACTLKRINYPTGGNIEFDFESHTSSGENVAGLRVSKITKNSNSSPPVVNNYSYSGNCLPIPFSIADYFSFFYVPSDVIPYELFLIYVLTQFYNFPSIYIIQKDDFQCPNQPPFIYDAAIEGDYIRVLTNPPAILNGAGVGIGYSKVTETVQGNGRTEYSFSSPDDYLDNDIMYIGGYDHYRMQHLNTPGGGIIPIHVVTGLAEAKEWPYLPVYSQDWRRSLLQDKKVYAEGSDSPTYTEGYLYNMDNTGNIAGYQVLKHDKRDIVLNHCSYLPPIGQYLVAKYYLSFNWVAPSRKYTCFYTSDGNIEETTDYIYNDDEYRLLNKAITTNSVGDTVETSYKYPSDIDDDDLYDDMESANMLNYPIEQTQSINDSLTNSRLITYKQDNSHYVADKVYSLEITSPIPKSSFNAFNGSFRDSRYGIIPELSFDDYDDKGNLIQYHKTDNNNISVIWGYNKTYPVAKFENADIASIEAATTLYNYVNQLQNYSDISNETNRNALRNINDNIRSNAPSNSLVTTYTYIPLKGMTSQTDPNGITTYYEYDDFGRLVCTRDDDFNILETYKYHYQTEE